MRFLVLAMLLMPAVARAQSSPQVDPRLSAPMVTALQAEIALRDAAIKAMQEDAKKREADWAEYSKPLWEQSVSPPK